MGSDSSDIYCRTLVENQNHYPIHLLRKRIGEKLDI